MKIITTLKENKEFVANYTLNTFKDKSELDIKQVRLLFEQGFIKVGKTEIKVEDILKDVDGSCTFIINELI